jgi:putative oxidoreductase
MIPYNSRYEDWAPLVARVFLAIQFGIAAYFKIVFWGGEVAQTAAVGVPVASVAVGAALLLEVVGVLALLTGYRVRPIALLLALYCALLAVLFYHNWSDQMTFGLFVSHMGLIAALLYVSAFGSGRLASARD